MNISKIKLVQVESIIKCTEYRKVTTVKVGKKWNENKLHEQK